MNDNIYEMIGKMYVKLQEAERDGKFWLDAYTNANEKAKREEAENRELRAELEKVKAELEQLLDNMLTPTEGACEV